jgi:predicted MPP superfamily phosphohydrolase
MRTFQLLSILFFLIFYTLVSAGAIRILLKIVTPAKKKIVFRLILVLSVIIITGFIILYIWPLTTRTTKEYTFHLIFNALLSIDFVFKIPLTIALLLGIPFSGKNKLVMYYTGFILSAGLASSVIYGAIWGRNDLAINNIELNLNRLPKEYDGLKILHISDIHLGGLMKSEYLMNQVLAESDKINSDIIFFTGDLVNNFSSELEGWKSIFQKITENKPSYAILGNHDYGNYSNWKSESDKIENFNQIQNAHKDFGFQLLNNENVKLKSGEDSIYIIGVENWGHPPFPQYANLEQAMNGVPAEAFKIFMTHDPSHWDEVIKKRGDVQLTLSGHTHGMQWGIIKAGITFSLSYFVRQNWGGLYNYEHSYLYVSTGLGTVGIPWRINMPAEITVITLKRIEID